MPSIARGQRPAVCFSLHGWPNLSNSATLAVNTDPLDPFAAAAMPISPAILGSLFQGVMDPRARRQIGAHYTSERDILKVIRPLFLDDLRDEFDRIKNSKNRLEKFHQTLAGLRFLDPACGCGDFLVIAYRELRLLEIDVLAALYGAKRRHPNIRSLPRVGVDAFYGIEISERPARIAEAAMWLMDRQMNARLSKVLEQSFVRLPLEKLPTIVVGNALRLDWKEILPPEKCSYVFGNPPFVGKHYQTRSQKSDLAHVLPDFQNVGDIDYVVGWFRRAAEYIQRTRIKVGWVATNSITQGEQVPLVWGEVLGRYGLTIHFAHRTFAWESLSRGKARVHVVVIGFAAFADGVKRIFDYPASSTEPVESVVSQISPYLTPGPSVLVTKRRKPLCNVPAMRCGNKPSDGGHLILTDQEAAELLRQEPHAKKYLRRYTGSEEFINGNMRWCLWFEGANPDELRDMPKLMKRIDLVRQFREKSTAQATRKAADRPTEFFYISQPKTDYILIPEVSSERRPYIPIGFMSKNVISANTNFVVPEPSLYLFGILTSAMHTAWMRQIGGRLESRYRYSGSMVYNTYPWPESQPEKQRATVENAAQEVLNVREKHLSHSDYGMGQIGNSVPLLRRSSAGRNRSARHCLYQTVAHRSEKVGPEQCLTLADLYDPLTMPPELLKAHRQLDRAVDRCYRREPFTTERQRVELLSGLYEKLTAPLLGAQQKTQRRSES